MEKTIDEVIKEGLAELPPYVKTAIAQVRPTEKMRLIGEKHKLHLDQQTVMEREVMLAMLGLIEGSDFVDVLAKEGAVDSATAQAVATDISNQIFIPIREAMRGSEKIQVPSSQAPNPPTPPPRPATVPNEPQKINTPQVLTPPTIKPASTTTLASVDEALNKPQSTPVQRVDVGIAPAKPRDYTNDPYLEPIE